MSYKYNRNCGIDAIDHYDDYSNYNGSYTRHHIIDGTGSVKNCNVRGWSKDSDSYSIQSGIIELCDECFSKSSVSDVSLPATLTKIGNRCFKYSKITNINLPESLISIGHNNFPRTLKSLNIPQDIKEFFVDNVTDCCDLQRISVAESNMSYKAKDGILYNFDMTEILFCPNAKTGKVIIPNTVTSIGEYNQEIKGKTNVEIIPVSA